MSKRNLCLPITALFFISLGGLLLHLKIHPPLQEAEYWTPAVFGIVTTFVLPFMFYYRKSAMWAYLVTWLAVVVGTVAMIAFSAEHWEGEVTLRRLILDSTFPDIMILFAKVPLAHMILKWWKKQAKAEPAGE